MPANRTGIATFFVNSQHSSSNNHSRSSNAHLNKLKHRSHLSSNLTNNSSSSNSHSNNNKEFHRHRFPSSQRTNKRTSEHSRLRQTNRMVVATSSRLSVCALTVKHSSRTVLVALHSALPKIRKRKAMDSRRNFHSASPATPQHKHSKLL
jgi:hypothetical protein